MFEHSDQVNELAAALCKAQAEMKPATKNAKNPFYKSNYATLDAVWESVRKPLSDNGLCVSQIPTGEGLVTVLLHTSGQWISGCLPYNAKDLTPQGIGSAITYCRRYALGAITGQATEEDDDGEGAMSREKKAPNRLPTEPDIILPTPQKKTKKPEHSLLCQKALDSLDKIDDGLNLAEWRTRFNRATDKFTEVEVAELEAAYAVKSEKMNEGHHD